MSEKYQRRLVVDQLLVLRDLDVQGTLTAGGGGTVTSVFGRSGAVVAANGDYVASQITVTPTGGLVATQAQAAFAELDSEIAAANAAHSTLISDLASTASSKGASLIGVQDSGGYFSSGDGEGALAELGAFKASVDGGTNVPGSPASGVTLVRTHRPYQELRIELVNIDVSILAANDYGSIQLATLAAGVIFVRASRVNLTVTDQSSGNLGTLDLVNMAVGTVAVDQPDMSTGGSQTILATVNATAGGVFQEIQLPAASVGFSNPIYLNVTQAVTSDATARFNGVIELVYIDLNATSDS